MLQGAAEQYGAAAAATLQMHAAQAARCCRLECEYVWSRSCVRSFSLSHWGLACFWTPIG